MTHSRLSIRLVAALSCLLLAGACTPAQDDGSPDAAAPPDAGLACPTAPSAALASPTTIAEAVALANGLLAGHPSLSIDCFLSALSRPLTVLGAVSIFSLQPSVGAQNPRIFIFSGNLVMSVVPAGDGSPFVELAEYTTPVRSIKGQLAFPVTAPVALAETYDTVRLGSGTICSGCHRSEQLAPQVTVTQAFESGVLQPLASDVVPLPQMQGDATTCDHQQEPQRCAILDAVFAKGPVLTGSFSPDAATIFE